MYTLRFAEAVREALVASGSFSLVYRYAPGNLTVSIPGAVTGDKQSSRLRIGYVVQFSRGGDPDNGRALGVSKGHCWSDEIEVCARQVVRDAIRAARKD